MITTLDKKTALVLIDLQKGIAQMQTFQPAQQIIQQAARLVEAFHKAGQPVVLVNVNPMDPGWVKTRVDEPSMVKNQGPVDPKQQAAAMAEFSQIVPELGARRDDIYITKHTWGAFFETALEEELKSRGVTGIVLGGISTSIGVEGTARHANERGFNISFAVDAMTDKLEEAHNHSIKTIFPRIGELGSTADIIGALAKLS